MIDSVEELVKNSYDLHVHSSPDIVPRKWNDIKLSAEAKKAGMAGILIKNHFSDTSSRVLLVKEVVKGLDVFGGIALNNSVGGLNPSAVEVSLKLGAKEVWMPTIDSLNHRIKIGKKGGLSILNSKKKLKKKIYEILELISQFNVILGTGHLSIEEIVTLVEESKKMGIEKVLITHPEYWITYMPIEIQSMLNKKGVFFERCYYSSTLVEHNVQFGNIIECIKRIGFQTTILSTDLGQKNNIDPIHGLKIIIMHLIESGFQEKQIRRMLAKNPVSLIY